MNGNKRPAGRWGLRQLGGVLLLLAYAAGRHLVAIAPAPAGNRPPLVYLLALVGFLGFSLGGALLVHGHHLFDAVEISERWRRLPQVKGPKAPEAAVRSEDLSR